MTSSFLDTALLSRSSVGERDAKDLSRTKIDGSLIVLCQCCRVRGVVEGT